MKSFELQSTSELFDGTSKLLDARTPLLSFEHNHFDLQATQERIKLFAF